MNILFVCSANKNRSKTAESYLSELYPEHNFMSAGTNKKLCMKEGGEFLTKEMLEWSDIVFVMEQKHWDGIRKETDNSYTNKIINLNIPDIYEYGDESLKEIIFDKTKKHIC